MFIVTTKKILKRYKNEDEFCVENITQMSYIKENTTSGGVYENTNFYSGKK